MAGVRAVLGESVRSFFGGKPTVVRLAVLCGVAELAWRNLFNVAVGVGPSMLPTLNGDERGRTDVVLVDRIAARSGNLRPGDVVVLTSPQGRSACKRLVGVADDIVLARVPDGKGETREQRIRVPKGFVWVEGDNPQHSRDSRQYGPVPLNTIGGRAFASVYPNPRWLGRTFEHVESGPPLRLREAAAEARS